MDLRQFVTSHFSNITELQQAASVWSGCGEIIRCQMNGAATVIKAIEVPSQINHSRIKQSDFALARKRQSYLVEFNWYRHYAKQLPHEAAAIHCIDAIQEGTKQALLFSDF
ncbi:MAG: kinase, partial [Pseudomonadota bacterium]|nr:kinase [Pseudomonadota bacterium]